MEKKDLNKKINIKKKSASFNLIEVIVIIIITALIVGVSSSLIVFRNYDKIENKSSIEKSEYLDEFIQVYNNIKNTYVEKVDEKALINAAIKALYEQLGDPHTSYLDKELTEIVSERLDGEYKGIGVEITKDLESGYVKVMNVFENSPAYNAGLKKGDYITKINEKNVAELTINEASKEIKKSINPFVAIEYLRDNVLNKVTIKLNNVIIPSIEKEIFNNTGYIKITSFSNTTYNQFRENLKELEQKDIKNLIIDVRDNTGGYLNAAINIVEMFIEKGKILYMLESKGKITETCKDSTAEKKNYDVVVLVNSASASASEILAAALKESYGAKLIGTKTFGKGTVQEKEILPSGEMIKHTTAYWLTPERENINNIGLTPTIEVNQENVEEYTYEKDTQLQTAIKELAQ